MSEHSKIEWTDHTFNPWSGCVKVSPACQHCYAAALPPAYRRHAVWGARTDRMPASDSYWAQPLAWDRKARKEGVRARVFCASTADVFEDRADLDPLRERLWDLIQKTPNLDWLLLTKRPEVMFKWSQSHPWPVNAWAGTTVESQEWADRRIPWLLKVPAQIRFLSCEPLLGAIDIRQYLGYTPLHATNKSRRTGVCGSNQRLDGDPRGRIGVENCTTPQLSLEGKGDSETCLSTSDRCVSGGWLSNSQNDGGSSPGMRTCASVSVETLSRSNTIGADNQSQEREQGGQQARESGISDLCGTGTSRSPCITHGTHSAPEWRGQLRTQTYRSTDAGDSEAAQLWRKTEGDCGGIRNQSTTGKQDRTQGSMGLGYVIAGGESGPNARPSHPDWFRSLRDQCREAGVPFLFKQNGEWISRSQPQSVGHLSIGTDGWGVLTVDGEFLPQTTTWNGRDETEGGSNRDAPMKRIGKVNAGRLLDGIEHNEFPKVK